MSEDTSSSSSSSASSSRSIPRDVVDVLRTTQIGYLTVTSKKGDLYTYPVAFHYSDPNVYLMTPVGSAKMKFIKLNPNVSFIVDNKKLATAACGAMVQGRAKAFSIARLLSSIVSVGPKMAHFAKKYPGMFTFYARGKELPPDRKLYKYRVIRIEPTKIVYWVGYKFGRYIPEKARESDGSLGLTDEAKLGKIAALVGSADEEPEIDPLPADEDWLSELKAATSSGLVSEEEGKVMGSLKILPQDIGGTAPAGKVTEGEKKLLKRWKIDRQ